MAKHIHAMHIRSTMLYLLALLGLSFGSTTHALQAGSSSPIEVTSDSAEIDELKGIATYTGNVVISQGQSKLSAHTVYVSAENQQLSKIEAKGSPARFQDASQTLTSASEQQHTIGQADNIKYNASTQTLSFIGKAKLRQGSNSFEGEQIIYDLAARAIKAERGQGPNERVKIQYLPATQSKAEPSKTTEHASDISEPVKTPQNIQKIDNSDNKAAPDEPVATHQPDKN